MELPEGSFQSNLWQNPAKASAIAPGADEGCVPPVARWTSKLSKLKAQKEATFLQGRHVPRERIKVPSHQCHQFEKVGNTTVLKYLIAG